MRAARSFLLVALLLVVMAMFGCASGSSGIRMTDDEAKACRTSETGCSVWTDDEVRALAKRWFKEGYRYGWTDANAQAARDL